MCHGEIRCGFFFLVESDITIFLPSTIGIFCFQPNCSTNIKTEKSMNKKYEAPVAEMIEIEVEQGFIGSIGFSNTPADEDFGVD